MTNRPESVSVGHMICIVCKSPDNDHTSACSMKPSLHLLSDAEMWQLYRRMIWVIREARDEGVVSDAELVKREIEIMKRRRACVTTAGRPRSLTEVSVPTV